MLSKEAFDASGPVFAGQGWVFFGPYRRGQDLSASAGPYIGNQIAETSKNGGQSAAAATMGRPRRTDMARLDSGTPRRAVLGERQERDAPLSKIKSPQIAALTYQYALAIIRGILERVPAAQPENPWADPAEMARNVFFDVERFLLELAAASSP